MKKKKIIKQILVQLKEQMTIIENNNRKEESLREDIKHLQNIVLRNMQQNKQTDVSSTNTNINTKEISNKPLLETAKSKIDNFISFDDIQTNMHKSAEPLSPKKIFISFLGKTSSAKSGFINKQAIYFSNIENLSFENEEYMNMTHLLSRFQEDSRYIQIATKDSNEFQLNIARFLSLPSHLFDNIEIIDNETNYQEIFNLINDIISKEASLENNPEIIIDLTHGFRHMSILAVLSIITQKITIKNLSHILFAKEIEKDQKYEVIDLIELIDVANIKYALETFNSGYSLFPVPDVKNQKYKELLSQLHIFSKIMTGNLFGEFLKAGKNSILSKLLQSLNDVIELEESQLFKNVILEIKKHISNIEAIAKLSKPYEQLEAFAKIFYQRKYYLNSIILLNEALGHLYADVISTLGISEVNKLIAKTQTEANYLYKLSNSARGVMQYLSEENSQILFLNNREITNKIRNKFNNVLAKENIQKIVDFTEELKKIRNNISHGTIASTNSLEHNIESKIDELFKTFDEIRQTRCYFLLNNSQQKKSETITTVGENYIAINEKFNFHQTLVKVKDQGDQWRIPNLTELQEIYKKYGVKNLPHNCWSSTEVLFDDKRNYILRNNEVHSYSKEATAGIILVNNNFESITDITGNLENELVRVAHMTQKDKQEKEDLRTRVNVLKKSFTSFK